MAQHEIYKVWKALPGQRCVFNSALLLMALLWAIGCDTVPSERFIQPEVTFEFIEPVQTDGPTASKAGQPTRLEGVVWDVTLIIEYASGEAFETLTQTVDDAVAQTADFDVFLPQDSTFNFAVEFRQNQTLMAQGTTRQTITRNTATLYIPVTLLPPADQPSVGFEPGFVHQSVSSTETVDLNLNYYSTGAPIRGLACIIEVQGVSVQDIVLESTPNLLLKLANPDQNTLELAWRWDQPVTGPLHLTTLRVPRDRTGQITFTIAKGNARASDDTTITAIFASGARVTVGS